MKIVVLHGVDHKGSTYHLCHEFLQHFSSSHIEEYFLPRDLPYFCKGCFACLKDETKCPHYEEKQRIFDSIEEADLLVFTTPTYCLRASAPMKSFIDLTFIKWMVHRPSVSMFHKQALILSTSAGANPKSAMKDIKACLTNWGVSKVKTYGIAVRAMNYNMIKDKKKRKMKQDMCHMAKRVKRCNKVKTSLKVKGLFSIMRLMHKGGMSADEADRMYWDEQGWLGKKRPWKNSI